MPRLSRDIGTDVAGKAVFQQRSRSDVDRMLCERLQLLRQSLFKERNQRRQRTLRSLDKRHVS